MLTIVYIALSALSSVIFYKKRKAAQEGGLSISCTRLPQLGNQQQPAFSIALLQMIGITDGLLIGTVLLCNVPQCLPCCHAPQNKAGAVGALFLCKVYCSDDRYIFLLCAAYSKDYGRTDADSTAAALECRTTTLYHHRAVHLTCGGTHFYRAGGADRRIGVV